MTHLTPDSDTPHNQISTVTRSGRHRPLIAALAAQVRQTGRRMDDLRVLSFGCSTGEECLTLLQEFGTARVFGAEIDAGALAQAQSLSDPRLTVMRSTEANLRRHGPYDVILALNVLCRYPETAGKSDISAIYPFAVWDRTMTLLDSLMVPGAYLLTYNSQYLVPEATACATYQPALEPGADASGWIDKCDRSGRRISHTHVLHDGQSISVQDWQRLTRADPSLTDPDNPRGRMRQDWIAETGRPGHWLTTKAWRKP